MKKKIISIILNQYFLSAIIAIAIIYFLPTSFDKYKIELKESNTLPKPNSRVYFEDLNNDAISEKIISKNNNLGNASFEIHNSEGGIIDQWNFNNNFIKIKQSLFFADANSNGFNEIYVFTQKKDSIFLNISEPFVKNGISKKNIFIDRVGSHNLDFKSNANSLSIGSKKNNNGVKDIYFELMAGFSGTPRNVYKYNVSTNTLVKSPHLTNTLTIDYILDINNDGFDEILLRGYANGNEIDTIYTKRTDYSSWITVLDNNLNFLFDPIEIKIPFSVTITVPLIIKNEYKLATLIDSRGNTKVDDKINLYSIDGKLEKTITPAKSDYLLFNHNNKLALSDKKNNQLTIFNTKLKKESNLKLLDNFKTEHIDFDNDNVKEWFTHNKNYNSFTIYRENFTHPVKFELPNSAIINISLSVIHTKKIPNGICLQKGINYYIYSYSKNPLYFFKYLIYIGVYLLILGFIWLILKGQKIRIEKQLAIENEIAQLQIKTIKNQVDPHFVFNAINTISEMTLNDNKLEVDNFICKFSDLMRKTLSGSDKISHTLKDEIDYTENFIQLQQIRFNNSFKYKIRIDKNIVLNTKVPKHIIYAYVENAIKHGLTNKENGCLKIHIQHKNNNLVLIIEDNGNGIDKKNNTKRNSTGNGLLIMEKIYTMYFKLYKQKISHRLIEVLDDTNNVIGIKIKVSIKNKFKH